MQLLFIQDIQRDINNWQTSITRKSYGIDWKTYLPSDISEAEVNNTKFLKGYLKKHFYQNGKISTFITWMNKSVDEEGIRNDLEILLDEKFPPNPISVYITTFHRAPYDIQQHFFYLIFREKDRERSITTIYHELMHFLFHIYYWEQCQALGLDEQQIHTVKESVTVLLNQILQKRGLPLDMGYPQHRVLREKFKHFWEMEPNLRLLIDKVSKFL
ncbi:hypothetical protein C4546_03515 [Candidatus Parcubacteria bacterium]|jgi:hypothetical protein|nr:MAG: hypothetical protein C4546_03515 [Candidatus Parcubacteria bacterium]